MNEKYCTQMYTTHRYLVPHVLTPISTNDCITDENYKIYVSGIFILKKTIIYFIGFL